MALLPVILLAQTVDERREDDARSGDLEAALPDDSLYFVSPAGEDSSVSALNRVRFVQAFRYATVGVQSFSLPSIWARTRLSVKGTRDFRTDLLAVRRVNDPQTFDEFHLTVSGRHSPSRIAYTVGTFELDWGLGTLSSASFGAARLLSGRSTFRPQFGEGVVARPVSREGGWLRGIALQREIRAMDFLLIGSDRPWNAATENGNAHLSGLIDPGNPSSMASRDNLDERLAGAAAHVHSRLAAARVLGQITSFSTPLSDVGSSLAQLSICGSVGEESSSAHLELARSGAETAWSVTANANSGVWQGLFFANYYSPDYVALRSQSPSSYGTAARNESTLGIRGGVMVGRHFLMAELRDMTTPSGTATVSPARSSTDAELNWLFETAESIDLSLRLAGGSREESRSDSVIDRDHERARLIARFNHSLDWVIRFDLASSHDRGGANPASGSYAHLQLSEGQGRFRPGARVAIYSIPTTVGPFLVFEPSVAGAYPLRTLIGEGRVVAAWITASSGSLYARAVCTLIEESTGIETAAAFGLEFGLRQ